MKIRRYNALELVIPVAELSIKNGNKVYNIVHGMSGKDTWEYRLGLNKRLIISDDNSSILMDKSDYVLQSIYRNGERIKDAKGNKLYYINRSPRGDISNHILLFINLPKYETLDVQENNVSLIAMAKEKVDGKIIDAPIYYFNHKNSYLIFTLDNKVKLIFTYNNGDIKLTKQLVE